MKRFVACLLAVSLFCAALPVWAEDLGYGEIRGGWLHLRAAPDVASAMVNSYQSGTLVRLLEFRDDWCRVALADGMTGWMLARYIRAVRDVSSFSASVASGDPVPLLAAPDAGSRVLAQVSAGAGVTLIRRQGAWWYLRCGPQEGWMAAGSLTAAASAGKRLAFTLDVDGSGSLVHQYGTTESLIDYGQPLRVNVQYPVSGLAAADDALRGWARQAVEKARASAGGAGGEIDVYYQSYLAGSDYASVVEAGLYTSAGGQRSELVFTLNVNRTTGALVTWQDILAADRLYDLYDLLIARLKTGQLNIPAGTNITVGTNWLDHMVLLSTGVSFILPRGQCLPDAVGPLRLDFTYAELGACLKQAPSGAQPQATPTPALTSPGTSAARLVDPSRPMLALTFDDGPSKQTPRILALLTQVGGRATFCMVGNRVENYAAIVRQVAAQGSEIAVHTWDHRELTRLDEKRVRSEITATVDVITRVAGVTPRLLRPPYGSVNGTVKHVCASLDMPIIHWCVDPEDWRTRNADNTYRAILAGASDGAIILSHDLYPETAEAMERVIPELVAEGYQLVTVSELLAARAGGGKAGHVYFQVSR